MNNTMPQVYSKVQTLGHLLRSLAHILFMTITVVPWAVVMIVASFLVKPDTLYAMCVGWLRLAMTSLRWMCGVSWRVSGLEHLPQGKLDGAILLSKHQSTFETFLLPTLMPHPLAYVFKRELLYVPFFGWAMGRLDMIHIDRSKRAEAFAKVTNQGQRLMARGIWIIMFPEGTRIDRGQTGNYKTGGTRLGVATGAPVIPIAVSTGKCWPRKAIIKRPGVIDVCIGPAISSVGREPDELMQEVQQWIETEMRRLDPEAYR